MTKIKNLIFDLDNTLYDFSSVWKLSNKLVFEYLGYDKLTTYEEFFKRYKRINNELVEKIAQILEVRYNEKMSVLNEEQRKDIEKILYLQVLDNAWR